MAGRFLEPTEVLNMMRLLESKTPSPSEITELKEEIESRTRAAGLKYSITGNIDMQEIESITQLKLRLDHFYGLWAQGKL